MRSCPECQQSETLPREPLLQHSLLIHPLERAALDLFEHKKLTCMLVVDYFSRFLEKLTLLPRKCDYTSKTVLLWHGIPAILITGNRPQQKWNGFYQNTEHATGSPQYQMDKPIGQSGELSHYYQTYLILT